MKPKNYEVLMDIYMGVLNAPAIQFTTEDFGMCQITFSLLEDRITPYNLSNCIVRMVINGQQQDCTISDANNGKAEIVLLQSMFTEVGFVTAELQIYDATNQTMRLTTPTFKYTVRKSLMDDNTVQADANYSILQQMILNVSNADKVSSEALKLSKEAKAICDDLVPKANTAAQNAQEALDRAESVVTQEELAQKVMLDGKDTKFDFIENKVVQAGLKHLSKINTSTVKSGINVQNNTDDFDIMIIVEQITYVTSSGNAIVMRQDTNSAKMDMRFQLTGGNYRVGVWISGINNIPVLQQVERPRYIGFKRKNGVYYSYTDTQVLELGKTAESISFTSVVFGSGSTEHKGFIAPIAYNRELSQEEKQYNLSDFNNLPAIKELHTTNAEGETSILKLASDEDHVKMASGRTLREEYMGVLKTMGKEFTSADGSPIEVNNGIKARAINVEIKGNSVKSIANVDNGFKTAIGDGTTKVIFTVNDLGLVKPSSDYTLVIEVILNTLNGDLRLVNTNVANMIIGTEDRVPAGKTGIFIVKLRSKANLSGANQIIRHALSTDSTSGSITYRTCVFEGDLTKVAKGFAPFGLVSTEAIISNNGEEYHIYANEEYRANKKVISLDGLEGARNKLELKEDGSAIFTQESKMYSSNYNTVTSTTNLGETTRFDFEAIGSKMNSLVLCDKVAKSEVNYESQEEHIYSGANKIWVFLKNTTLNGKTPTEWLKENTLHVIAPLDTPIITHIPKELVPAILTHKTNILEVGGAVKPSSFKVTLPVDRIAELTARLEAVEAKTNTQPVNTAFVDETYAKSVNKIEEVIK